MLDDINLFLLGLNLCLGSTFWLISTSRGGLPIDKQFKSRHAYYRGMIFYFCNGLISIVNK